MPPTSQATGCERRDAAAWKRAEAAGARRVFPAEIAMARPSGHWTEEEPGCSGNCGAYSLTSKVALFAFHHVSHSLDTV
jgi:hypothetical protein